MAIPSLFLPLLAFFGIANLAYAVLNFKLLQGLANLAKPRLPNPEQPSVTVLIAARNEEQRLGKTLDCLLAQDYPADRLQIVVVDDRSEDGTAALLRSYVDRAPGRLQAVTVSRTAAGQSPKKFALSQGMQQARGEIIVTTDADCVMGPAWVSAIVAEFGDDTGLVLGMTTYTDTRGVWDGTASLEFFSYGVVASALVGLGFPVHGNANNIAYRRKVYDLASGFQSHGRIVSGDDDFLIQGIHALGRWKIRYTARTGSQVSTEPPESAAHFWEQRKRWASKCGFYQPKQVAFLGAIFTYYCLILICLAAGAFLRELLWIGGASWLIKTGTDFLVMRKGARLFGKSGLMRWFPTTCIVHIPLIIAAVVAGTFGQFTWKGQKSGRVLTAR